MNQTGEIAFFILSNIILVNQRFKTANFYEN